MERAVHWSSHSQCRSVAVKRLFLFVFFYCLFSNPILWAESVKLRKSIDQRHGCVKVHFWGLYFLVSWFFSFVCGWYLVRTLYLTTAFWPSLAGPRVYISSQVFSLHSLLSFQYQLQCFCSLKYVFFYYVDYCLHLFSLRWGIRVLSSLEQDGKGRYTISQSRDGLIGFFSGPILILIISSQGYR